MGAWPDNAVSLFAVELIKFNIFFVFIIVRPLACKVLEGFCRINCKITPGYFEGLDPSKLLQCPFLSSQFLVFSKSGYFSSILRKYVF